MEKYTVDQFNDLGQSRRVDIFILEILKFLKENSGKSDRKELVQFFIEQDEIVPSEWIVKEFPGKMDHINDLILISILRKRHFKSLDFLNQVERLLN